MKEEKSFWFWALPPVLLGAAFAVYHFHLADSFFKQEKSSVAPTAAPALPPAEVVRRPPVPQPSPPPETPPVSGPDAPVPQPAPENAPVTDLRAAELLLPRLAAALSADPDVLCWLKNEHILRYFVAAVDCVAAGTSPRPHLPFFHLRGGFRARPAGRREFQVDPVAYGRYDAVAAAFASLDPKGCRATYHRLEPVLDELYHDLGYADGSFRTLLAKAVHELLATPVPGADARLRQQGGLYVWADPELEHCNEAQKHLLRMGPDNMRNIQEKLRQLAAALDLPLLK
jgi:hypothetical protein